MPITKQQFIERAVREARGGLSEEEANVYEDVAILHLEDALQTLVRSCQRDQMRRPLLTRVFRLPKGLTADPTPMTIYELPNDARLWVEGIRYATVHPGQGVADAVSELQVNAFLVDYGILPMQWEAERAYQMLRGVDTVTGTFSYQQGLFYVMPVSNAVTDHLIVQGLYVPDFSDVYPMPDELIWPGIQVLAGMLRKEAPVKA